MVERAKRRLKGSTLYIEMDGGMLNKEAGIPKGPAMGTVLNYLLEAVMDDPAMNTKEVLLNLGKNFYQTRLQCK